ncbi:MAG: peptide chain release factor 2 [Patescibacteria group bacterium]
MEELRKKIKELLLQIDQAIVALDIPQKHKRLDDLRVHTQSPNFWQKSEAANIVKEISNLELQITDWENLKKQLEDLEIVCSDNQADDLLEEFASDFSDQQKKYEQLAQQLLLSGQYDQAPAIITINAGAGGVDAQDWAQMLERMYLRFGEKNNYQTTYLSRTPGNEAGIKSATFKFVGPFAYGYLKEEAGVHRLVRLSEFDADHARHTSFAMVEVLPEIIEPKVKINDSELRVETFRASGHGGQSVNTTDSAVRIVHLPTGLTAVCQNERSQLQNKNQALVVLLSKLERYQASKKEEERQALKGEYTAAAWGNQIRSYVLHPYKMVKDHRTEYESHDPNTILDGDLWPLIKASLRQVKK